MSMNISANAKTSGIVFEAKSLVKPSEQSSNSPQAHSIEELEIQKLKGANVSIADEQIVKAIDNALKAIQGPNTRFELSIHDETNWLMIKVFNKDTGELIREIPKEKRLDLIAQLREMTGLIIDEKA